GFPAAFAARIARVPGVRTTAPVLDARVELEGPRGQASASLVGGDRSLVALGGALLHEFASPHLHLSQAVALPRPLARALGAQLGGDVGLAAGGRRWRAPVATLLGADEIGALADSPVVRALTWIDKYGDADGDGFVEYARESKHGLAQQGWKDSWDSVFHRDGTLAEPPIALCEVQGYTYAAKIAAAALSRAL